jgi:hypothetical protein
MKDFINQQNRNIYTKNMFVESHYELNISLFIRDLNEAIIIEAYEKLLNDYVKCVKDGITPSFNISDKKEAKDYLINFLNKYK